VKPLDLTIQVSFSYSVHFTHHVFSSDNSLLAEVVAGPGEGAPARVLFVIDHEVARSHPSLQRSIEFYCLRHAAWLELAGPPLVVPGGEVVKSSPTHFEALHKAINRAGLCRHSYLIAVGGGSVLDLAG
jgi:3-dehydroquinate synthase